MTKRDTTDWISDIHTNGLDVSNRVIYLTEKEDVSDNTGVDYRMLQNFVKNIKILECQNDNPITIYIQTQGGCWDSGMGIYDMIKMSKCKINMIGYGQLCSMGTIIIQAADKRILMPNCVFMCHYGSTSLTGEYLNAQNYAVIDKNNMNNMINIYAERCIKGEFFRDRDYSLSKVKSYIKRKMKDGDWYMDSESALEYGFIDNVFSRSLKI
jgi:ATP-dependent Clp protease protease subunit